MMHDGANESRPDITRSAISARRFEAPAVQGEDAGASASVRFVRLCGRTTLFPGESRVLSELGAALSANEWLHVIHVAANEGMLPLVFLQVARTGLLQTMPPEAATALSDGYRQTLLTNRSLLREQQDLLSAFGARGIEAIPLKGLSLAARYYQEVGLRPTSDLDLLVRRKDLQRVDQALRDLGYLSLGGRPSLWNFTALLHGDLSYTSPKGTRLELHWELTHRPTYRMGLSPDRAWARARTVDVAGKPILCLSTSDELRFLCVHCTAGHQIVPAGMRLIWLLDIAKLVCALPPEWDWQAFIDETIAQRLATPVYLALSHAQSYLNLDLPAGTLDALRDAANTQPERDAWRFAQGDIYTAEGIRSHLGAAHTAAQTLAFLRGVILPSPAWIRAHYARRNEHDLPLWRVYATYYGRLLKRLPELVPLRAKK
jgi:hypothetical protein